MEAINHLLPAPTIIPLLTINVTFFSNKWDSHIRFVHRVDVWGGETNGGCWRAVAEDEFQLKNKKGMVGI